MKKVQISDILKISLFPFVVYVVANAFNRLYSGYHILWWLNVLFHFLGGFSMASSGYLILNLEKNYKKIKTANIFVDFILIINFVIALAVLWEVHELISDIYFLTTSQVSNLDTMKDLIMGGLGALFFCLLWLIHQLTARLAK